VHSLNTINYERLYLNFFLTTFLVGGIGGPFQAHSPLCSNAARERQAGVRTLNIK